MRVAVVATRKSLRPSSHAGHASSRVSDLLNREVNTMADARVMKEREQETELTEAQIAVHWKEEQYYYPSAKFIGQSYLTDPAVNERLPYEFGTGIVILLFFPMDSDL